MAVIEEAEVERSSETNAAPLADGAETWKLLPITLSIN
jgi:hypothetical protein